MHILRYVTLILLSVSSFASAQCFGNCAAGATAKISFVYQRRPASAITSALTYYNVASNQLVGSSISAGMIMGESFTKVRLMIKMNGTQQNSGMNITVQKNYSNTGTVCTIPQHSSNFFCDTGEQTLAIGPGDVIGFEISNPGGNSVAIIDNVTFVAIP